MKAKLHKCPTSLNVSSFKTYILHIQYAPGILKFGDLDWVMQPALEGNKQS